MSTGSFREPSLRDFNGRFSFLSPPDSLWHLRLLCVHLHDVVVHEPLGSEEREAAGRAEDAAHHVLGRLLQPMADRILELLVPGHEAGSGGEKKGSRRVETWEEQRIDGL